MVRTLTIVSLLALLAGLSLGWFVHEARATATIESETRVDPDLERKVQLYVAQYSLEPAQAQEIRLALKDYDQGLLDLFRRLRSQHKEDFKTLSNRADARIDAVLHGRTGK